MKQEKIYLKDYQAPDFSVLKVKLEFQINKDHCRVTATSQVQKLKATAPMILNGVDLKLESLEINGKPLLPSDYQTDSEHLTISSVPDSFELKVVTILKPHENTSLEGLYKSGPYLVTQCEAQGFRKITYFWDRPDVMTTYEVMIEADEKEFPILLSNGDRIKTEKLAGGRSRAFWSDPHKKPCYLFALFAGDIGMIQDHFVTASGRKVNLEVYAAHGKQDRCWHAMESLKKAMKWDEEKFGREYDLNDYMIVAIDDFNAGAMENKGLNIFNSRLVLADKKSATDNDFFLIESVVAHEYFHNWTGNRVTLSSWFQLSLKEGLTVFRDQEFSADMLDRGLQRIDDVESLRDGQFEEDASPNAHPVRPESCMAVDNFFTMTIYEKGAELIRMMQTLVGRKGFRKGMDLYFSKFDGKAVTTDDFAAAIAEANQIDLTQLKLWYSQAGTPEVTVQESYDAQKKEYQLTLSQFCRPTPETTEKKPFHIPLLMGLIGEDGQDLKLTCSKLRQNSDGQDLIDLKESKETFLFTNVPQRPRLSLGREFSAPIKIHHEVSDQDLFFLMRYDSDSFNRFEASQRVSMKVLKKIYGSLLEKNETVEIPQDFLAAFGEIIGHQQMDKAFKAKMLGLPNLAQLVQEVQVFDAKLAAKALLHLESTIAHKFETELLGLYEANLQDDRKARRLKACALGYLVNIGAKYEEMIWKQYQEAQQMTDQATALRLLTNSKSQHKSAALEQFFQEWSEDSVVLNKWFAFQALSEQSDTFSEVQKLYQHPKFRVSNPNNVYSLLGNLNGNLTVFHGEPGVYDWFADRILEIDALNPQVAARLCSAFNLIGKLPEKKKEEAKTAIRKVLANEKLSKNSRELLQTL